MKTYQINEQIEFAGKLNYLKLPSNNIFAMEEEDFVISLQIFRTGVNTNVSTYPMYLIDNRVGDSVGFSLLYDCNVSKLKLFIGDNKQVETKTGLPTNKWTTIHIVRKRKLTSLFVDTQLVGDSFYDNTNYTNNVMHLGCRYEPINNDSRTWYGYILNFSIIKGVSFYPPQIL